VQNYTNSGIVMHLSSGRGHLRRAPAL